MTPAEEDARVKRVMQWRLDPGDLAQAITDELRAAVAAERERCAYICDRWSGVGDVVARAIATAIRRGDA